MLACDLCVWNGSSEPCGMQGQGSLGSNILILILGMSSQGPCLNHLDSRADRSTAPVTETWALGRSSELAKLLVLNTASKYKNQRDNKQVTTDFRKGSCEFCGDGCWHPLVRVPSYSAWRPLEPSSV